MGCYGIGPGRVLASIIEQNNDEKGMILPIEIAPYKVAIVLISNKDEQQVEIANKLYEELKKNGIEAILDDRDERPGVKFNDMDLIGIPLRITVGKKVEEGKVEFKTRVSDEVQLIEIESVVSKIQEIIKNK